MPWHDFCSINLVVNLITMHSDKKRSHRLQLLNQCFADTSRHYTLDDLMKVCHISRATLERDLQYIRGIYGDGIFADKHIGKKRVFQYSTPSFSICEQELSSTQLAQINSLLLLLNKFVGKPQFESLQFIIHELERKYNIQLPDNKAVIHFDGSLELTGIEYLVPLFEAIIKKQCKQIYYQPFNGQKRLYIAHPYLLKEYDQRWYLLCGKQDEEDGTISLRTLALDRIEKIEDLQVSFRESEEDVNDYFHNIIGVANKLDHEVKDIVIKCYNEVEYKYIITKPIHPTQRPIKDKPNHVLIKVKENYELYQHLLFYGDKIEIVSPADIRKEFKKIINSLHNLYSK